MITQLDVLTMIGDVLTQIDVARGSLLPDSPDRHKLDDLRILLDDRQRKLSQAIFDDNTQNFQQAATALKNINDQIKGTITQINNMVAVLDNVSRFLAAATTLLTVI